MRFTSQGISQTLDRVFNLFIKGLLQERTSLVVAKMPLCGGGGTAASSEPLFTFFFSVVVKYT